MVNAPLDLLAINGADPAVFAAALDRLFEGAPGFLDRLARHRPFDDWPALVTQARAIAHSMPEIEQIALINAHPRLGAPPASVSELSFREQGYDLDAAARSAGQAVSERNRIAVELDRLNLAYEDRFGFRYCVHVAGRARSQLLPDMEASLHGAREVERHRALDAVVDIAADRLSAIRASAT